MIIRPAEPGDVAAIAAIYNDVLRTSTTTWSEREVSDEERLRWLEEKSAAGFPVLVAMSDDVVVGFVAGAFRPWSGYDMTVEHSIHVRTDARGHGVGTRLLAALEAALRSAGVHVMVAGVDAENVGSIRFHGRSGFAEDARMPEVGRLRGTWRELVLMQKILT